MTNETDQHEYTPRDTSKGYSWLKFRTDLIDDSKYFRMSDTARALYFELYLLAGKSDAGGLIMDGENPATILTIAWILRRAEDEVAAAIEELEKLDWIQLEGYRVTVPKFTSEQGPAMSNKRKAWAKWQQDKRDAAINGKIAGPRTSENSESVKDLKEPEPEQEKDLKTQTKRVIKTSGENQRRVINDSERDEYLGFSEAEVLAIWNEKKGRNDPKPAKLAAMVQAWNAAGVSLETIAQAIDQFDSADTLQYFENIATWSRNGAKKTKPNAAIPPQGKNDNLDAWRKLSDKYKNGGWK